MKKLINTSCCILLIAAYAVAQDAPVRFMVLEDNVKPSMNAQYKEGLRKLKAACEENKISTMSWRTVWHDDYTYRHLIPIKGMADLDQDMTADLQAKMGKEAMGAIFTDLSRCVERQSSFVVSHLRDLSYMEPAPEENYRDVMFWQVLPDKEMEAQQIAMEWKKMHDSKKAVGGYAAYKIDFGEEPSYIFVWWAKDDIDLATRSAKNRELFGAEGDSLWEKTLLITKKINSTRGWIMPEFSYKPEITTAKN
jgi:hypothetical protein